MPTACLSLTKLRFRWSYWYKTYDKKEKNAEDAKVCFLKNHKKKEMEIFAFCVINFELIASKTW